MNPRAGLAARRVHAVVERGRPSWRLEILATNGPRDATRLAREAARDGVELVLAVGGDGTASEVAEGLAGSSTALGIVPAGSGNGLARALGIPLDPERALRALEHGRVQRMDVGEANGRVFVNVASAGFDAAVAAAYHDRGTTGARRGVLPYALAASRLALGWRAPEIVVTSDGEGFRGSAVLVACMNGRQYGGGAILAPLAEVDDGSLDVVVVEAAALPQLALAAPLLFAGRIDAFSRFRTWKATRVAIECEGGIAIQRDGETDGRSSRVDVAVRAAALDVLLPDDDGL